MGRKSYGVMLAAMSALLASPAFAQTQLVVEAQLPAAPAKAAPARLGSLYPSGVSEAGGNELEKSLGPAGYILDDVGQSEAFRDEIRRAVGIHPVFHKEVSALSQARAEARAERAALYPRLSANLSGDYILSRTFDPNTDNVVESLKPERQLNAGVSLSQLIFDGGATFARIKGAKANARAEQQSISSRINELALKALSAYHDLATHQALLRVGEDYIRQHERLLDDVKERNRLGAGSYADVMQASARLAAARARVSQIRESMRLAEVRYEEFFKEEPGLLVRPSFEAVAVGSRAEAEALAIKNNPEIAAAQALSDSATANYKAEKASRLPELRANVNAVKYNLFENSDDYDVRAGINMNYDIFAGGSRGARIKSAAEAARQQRFDEERVREEIERDAAIAYEQHAASNERLSELADAVIANYKARDLVAQRFRASRGDLIDILQAENDYFEAAMSYLAGLADRDMATYALMEHTGDLLRYFSPQPADAEGGARDE